jgi:hypothetical protein
MGSLGIEWLEHREGNYAGRAAPNIGSLSIDAV